MSDSGIKKILIADDNQTFLMYMGILLKRMGFTVIPAEDGLEVLKLLKIVEPDVIMLDIRLGTMDGASIQLKGDIVYIKGLFGDVFKVPPGMGIKFKEITDDQVEILKNYTERLIAEDILDSQEEAVIEI